MKTALFIHSFCNATQAVHRHWAFFKRSGWDLFGIGRTNTKCRWPDNIPTRDIGLDAYVDGDNLCRRMVETYEWFMNDERFRDYTHACIVEYDSIFIKPAPFDVLNTPGGYRAGGSREGFKAIQFFHCPWWVPRVHLPQFIAKAHELLDRGEIEHGTPDFFYTLVFQELNIIILDLPGTFSQNTIDSLECQQQCRERIAKGELWFLHGIKTAEQLNHILPHDFR